MTEKEKWEWVDNNFRPTLYEKIEELNNGEGLYYEVYIDFDECAMMWFDYMYNNFDDAVKCIAKWMIKQDKWYWSPEYVDALNNAMHNTDDFSAAFTKVLMSSLPSGVQ